MQWFSIRAYTRRTEILMSHNPGSRANCHNIVTMLATASECLPRMPALSHWCSIDGIVTLMPWATANIVTRFWQWLSLSRIFGEIGLDHYVYRGRILFDIFLGMIWFCYNKLSFQICKRVLNSVRLNLRDKKISSLL